MKLQFMILLLAFAWSAAPLCAQVDRAAITGTIHDPSGAAVGGARITATYSSTGASRTALSNESGVYLIAGLPVGSIAIVVENPGFRTIRTETELKVGETKTFDFSFALAGVDETVEVVAEPELVRTTAAFGSVIDNKAMTELP